MTADNDPKLVVVPFNTLPAKKGANPTPEKIALRRSSIRNRIVNRENTELYNDPEAMALLEKLGSDLMINAFACNFKINGKINEDIKSYSSISIQVEANYLNNRIFSRLSVMTVDDVVGDRPMILTSSIFEQSVYKGCLDNFKRRLGLEGDQDLFVLVNLVKGLDVLAREEIEFFVLGNNKNSILPDLLKEGGSFKATIFEGLPSDHKPLCTDFVVSNIHVVVDESLSSNALDTAYPAQMPFYLYGTAAQPHVDHVLGVSPSIQLNSDRVTLELAECLTQEQLAAGVVAIFTDVLENSMQPIRLVLHH
ncbi:hypothetical protein DFP73DRAFT_532317 [Morchella snyderi]|nr:hypothetical protein DFP73DRAFT_532317 [Morchella snyderi]